MHRYTTIAPITLHTGIVELTPEQAAPRLYQLNDLGEGLYEITGPVQFKAGETIGYDGDINKALMERLTESAAAPGTVRKPKK